MLNLSEGHHIVIGGGTTPGHRLETSLFEKIQPVSGTKRVGPDGEGPRLALQKKNRVPPTSTFTSPHNSLPTLNRLVIPLYGIGERGGGVNQECRLDHLQLKLSD